MQEKLIHPHYNSPFPVIISRLLAGSILKTPWHAAVHNTWTFNILLLLFQTAKKYFAKKWCSHNFILKQDCNHKKSRYEHLWYFVWKLFFEESRPLKKKKKKKWNYTIHTQQLLNCLCSQGFWQLLSSSGAEIIYYSWVALVVKSFLLVLT